MGDGSSAGGDGEGALAVDYLTLEDLETIHAEQLSLHGGSAGYLNEPQLGYIVNAPRSSGFGQEYYPTIEEKAATYLYLLAESHVFVDGNKRTAAVACLEFLAINGFELDLMPGNLADFVQQIAAGSVCRKDVVTWVRDRVRTRP